MTIYANILSAKPHNPHYLNRYIRFIERCQIKNIGYTGYTEDHHICPKADDMFPEYMSFAKHPWNCISLSTRQHVIAHWILWKAYPGVVSVQNAFWLMSHTRDGIKLNSRILSKLREEHSIQASEIQKEKVKNGTHHFLNSEMQSNISKKRVENGTHNWLGGEEQRKRLSDPKEREKISEQNRKRVAEGTHNWIGDGTYQRELQNKRLENNTHHFQKGAPCVNKQGEIQYMPKSKIDESDEWVSVASKEGRERLGNNKESYLKNKVRVVDQKGDIFAIESSVFWSLKDNDDDTLVAISSKEGRKRTGKTEPHPSKNLVTVVDPTGNTLAIKKELYDKDTYVMVRSKEGQRRLKEKRESM